jgi:hypothetical protein
MSKNPDLERHWLLKSAEQGFADAQGTLRYEYNDGRIFSQNFAKAVY